MKKGFVSVIIPVYKTEQYLKECMDSVLVQDYPYIEIILVDDGSPDNCPLLCDEYAAKYENVQAVHQKNCRLGLSRNAGMRAASGEYIFFWILMTALMEKRRLAGSWSVRRAGRRILWWEGSGDLMIKWPAR